MTHLAFVSECSYVILTRDLMTLMVLSLASIELNRDASTTMELVQLCELVALQVTAFPPTSFPPSPHHWHHAYN
jgi:hypothetical protein